MDKHSIEHVARLRKANALVDALDESLTAIGTPPHSDLAAGIVEAMTEQVWAQTAQAAGVNPPSLTTRLLIIARYRDRAERQRLIREHYTGRCHVAGHGPAVNETEDGEPLCEECARKQEADAIRDLEFDTEPPT